MPPVVQCLKCGKEYPKDKVYPVWRKGYVCEECWELGTLRDCRTANNPANKIPDESP